MKKKLVLIGTVLAIVLLGVVGCGPEAVLPTANDLASTSVRASGTGSSTQNVGVWVSGEGKVMVAPDLVILTLGIESQEETVAEAHRKAAEAMYAIMQVLKNQGIADKDIQTQYFNIRQVTRWVQDENKEEVIGYRVTNTVTAKVRELDQAGEIIDAVAAAAGDLTRINGISFTVEDPAPFYTQAREKAMEDAIAKATQMAELAGVALGKPTYISEGGGYYPPVPTAAPRAYDEMAGGTPTTSISPGELEIRTTVSMVFDIG